MKGRVSTYLPEKKYGFIQGDDGKDYFFHQRDFRNQSQVSKIADEAFVEFDQQATPKGYRAKRCSLLNPDDILTYVQPNEFLTSKSSLIHGWELFEVSDWIVKSSSRESIDAAREALIDRARQIDANALVDLHYTRTTDSTAGSGRGTYYYSTHHFRGRPVTLAKRNSNGPYTAQDLAGINLRAQSLKAELVKKTKASEKRTWIVWLFIMGISIFIWVSGGLMAALLPVGLGLLFFHAENYDNWLVPIETARPREQDAPSW